MIHSVSTLEHPDRRFNSLKPRLLKCTTKARESMATSENSALPLETRPLPRLTTENHDENIRA